MKKIISFFVAILMLVMVFPTTAFAEEYVAQIGETNYTTLAAAVEDAENGDTITLLNNAEGGVIISKNLTIDLNGKTFDIKQGVGSTGTETNGIQLLKGNTVTIKNGTLFSSVNLNFIIKNYANLTIENLTIKKDNLNSGLATVANCGQLTVNDCVIESVDNDSWSITTGNYEHGDAVVTTINSGTFDSVAIETPLWEIGGATVDESVKMEILGGQIGKVGEFDWRPAYSPDYDDAPVIENPEIIIKGGLFGNDPSAFLASGYKAFDDGTAPYTYRVGEIQGKIQIAPPAVKPPVAPTNPTDEETAAVNAIASGTEKINASGLGAAVTSKTISTQDGLGDTLVTVGTNGVQQTTAEIINDVLENKDAPEIVNSASVDDLIVVVQPKLVIEVEGVVEDDGKKILKLDISAESQAIVTTKTLAGSNEALDNTNSVPVGTSVPVQIDTPVTLTIPVPAGFVGDDADNIFVDHTMHNGKIETVKATYDSQNNTITFTVNGMSPMNVKMDARTATIDYPDNTSETYRADDVRELLPVAQKSGYRFVGWKFANVPNAAGTYLTMTDELLTALSENGNTVTAEPMFEELPAGSSGVVHKIGAAAAEGNEVNPNTGAESAVGAAAAIAIVSLAAIVISKKK